MNRKNFLKLLAITPFALYAKKQTHEHTIFKYGAKGDGKTDDTKAFIRALKKNKELYLPKGKTFIVESLVVSNVKLFGGGTLRSLKSKHCLLVNGSSSIFDNITFKSSHSIKEGKSEIKLLDGCENITFKNCLFVGRSYCSISADSNGKDNDSLIYKKQVKNLIVENSVFKGTYSRHLYLHNIKDVKVMGCSFNDSYNDSIRLRQKVSTVLISKNTFNNIGTSKTADSKDAIDTFWSGKNLIIENNQIETVGTHGLDIKGVEPKLREKTSNVIISKNNISRAAFSGIFISSATEKDTHVENFIVENNMISKCNQAKKEANYGAIYIHHGVRNLNIHHNNISNNHASGIVIGNFSKTKILNENVSITFNQLSDNYLQSQSFNCINIFPTKNLVVHANQISFSKKRNAVGLMLGSDKNLKQARNYSVQDNQFNNISNNIISKIKI
ncbi:MAG: right-handed parallel beta-helix repeat-containing protein [Bacteriovoracaceae bacterium]|nr:right-handed parallel beta-helix repeat-containing protein [Bacteriovoracaceae bacterium]